jgi:hypothetical protein
MVGSARYSVALIVAIGVFPRGWMSFRASAASVISAVVMGIPASRKTRLAASRYVMRAV